MSVVGVIIDKPLWKKRGKVIAFADSKGSRVAWNGDVTEDIQRGEVQKIFCSDTYVAVTCGSNDYVVCENGVEKTVLLEEFMRVHLNDDINKTMELLQMEYHKSKFDPETIFLYIEKDLPFITKAVVSKNSVTLKKEHIIKSDMYCEGDAAYCNRITSIKWNLLNCSESDIQKKLEDIIDAFDHIPFYNPAGKPVHVVEWNM